MSEPTPIAERPLIDNIEYLWSAEELLSRLCPPEWDQDVLANPQASSPKKQS